MLHELHEALRTLLYMQGSMEPADVDVRFDAPTREWIERLTRPTIDLFLFALEENVELRQMDFLTGQSNGKAQRRPAPRRIKLQYMVSALATEVKDEHALLWRTLAALMRTAEWPVDILPESVRALDTPVTARVIQPDEDGRLLNLWTALGSRPHPALHYVLTAPLDLDLVIESPLVLTRSTRFHPVGVTVSEGGQQIGGTVRDQTGDLLVGVAVTVAGSAMGPSVTDAEGRFTLRGLREGATTLHVTAPDGREKTVTVEVPSSSYDIELT